MSSHNLSVRIKNKIDSEENFIANNFCLLNGEIGYATEEGIIVGAKIGNGKNGWNELDYYYDIRQKIFIINEDLTLEYKHNHAIIFVTSGNITLPYIKNKFSCIIKNVSGNNITLSPSETTIDGKSDVLTMKNYDFLSIIQMNSQTYIINSNMFETQILGELTMNNLVHSV